MLLGVSRTTAVVQVVVQELGVLPFHLHWPQRVATFQSSLQSLPQGQICGSSPSSSPPAGKKGRRRCSLTSRETSKYPGWDPFVLLFLSCFLPPFHKTFSVPKPNNSWSMLVLRSRSREKLAYQKPKYNTSSVLQAHIQYFGK